jgi:hypothetical protein
MSKAGGSVACMQGMSLCSYPCAHSLSNVTSGVKVTPVGTV